MAAKIEIPNLDDLLRRYVAGDSENQLAKEAGVNRWTFRQRLIKAGIAPRNQSEAEAIKWDRMSPKQRRRQVRAAHDAARGRDVPFDELCYRAKMREGNMAYNVSQSEVLLGQWMRKAGLPVLHNLAVGPYNCDIGTGPVAVEVWGGSWHPKPIDTKRTKYILDAGYSVLIVDLDKDRFPLTRAVLKYVVALRDATSRNPSGRRQYWMVRGDGELIFKRFNGDKISLVPPFTARRNPANGQYQRVPR